MGQPLSNALREVVLFCTQNMSITVKNNAVGLVVPPSVRRRAGIKAGDRLEFKVSGGIMNIIPKLPSADDEYTPAQRRAIDAQLKDAAKGPYHGPFETADAAIKFLRTEVRTRKTGKSKTAKR
jgi:bifunctional DNA-binding transcriptional regulator/antitoxin component of YhaV-PrlF toxin-antitoxin module